MVQASSVRSPRQVMVSVLRALMIRDIQKRFIVSAHTKRGLGFLWLFFEPLLHVLLLGGVRVFYDVSTPGGLPTVLFILLGVLPFIMARSIMSNSHKLIASNRNILIFRQIDIFDIALSWWITEFAITLAISIFIIGIASQVGVEIHWYDPLRAIFFVTFFMIFMLGISLVIMVLGFYFTRFGRMVVFLQRALYFSSGIFFPVTSIPPKVRVYFLINPLFQVIEGLRESFMFNTGLHCNTDLFYLVGVSLFALSIGLLVYVTFRRDILVSITERV